MGWQTRLIFCPNAAQPYARTCAVFHPRSSDRAARPASAVFGSDYPSNRQRAARFHCRRNSPASSLAIPAEPRRHGRDQSHPAISKDAKPGGEIAWAKPTPRTRAHSKDSLRGSANDERRCLSLARSHPSFGCDPDDKRLADLSRGSLVRFPAALIDENCASFVRACVSTRPWSRQDHWDAQL